MPSRIRPLACIHVQLQASRRAVEDKQLPTAGDVVNIVSQVCRPGRPSYLPGHGGLGWKIEGERGACDSDCCAVLAVRLLLLLRRWQASARGKSGALPSRRRLQQGDGAAEPRLVSTWKRRSQAGRRTKAERSAREFDRRTAKVNAESRRRPRTAPNHQGGEGGFARRRRQPPPQGRQRRQGRQAREVTPTQLLAFVASG